VGFLSNWFRKDAAHDDVAARSKREMRHRCRVEKLQDRRPMAADIHIGAVYYEDTTDGLDTTGDVIDISWTGGPAGAELTRLVIDMDKNGNGILDPGETFFDTAGPNFGVAQFGNSDLQLLANGFTINSATTLTGLSAQWDGATSIVLTFSGFNAGEHLLIMVDVDEQGFFGNASALVEGNEFQFTKMEATFAAPHYKNVTGNGVFMDDYVDSLADRVGLPRDDFNAPPALPVPLRTAGAFFSMIPEPLGSIRGNVHADYDGDCLVDPGEPLLQGVTIELLDAQGNVLRTTLTDVNGNYEFLDLDQGTYGVREVQPAQYFNGGTLPGTINGVVVGTTTTPNVITGIQLAAGAQGVEYNFCEKFGSISGRVHAEHDGDLVYEAGEVLVAGTTMELLNANGVVIATTTTDANGEYLFDRLLIGTYSVREQQPALYFDSGDKVGQVGGVTTGTNGSNDRIDGIALVADRFGVRYDFVERYGSISGFVLSDKNGDCIQNNGETGIAGVRMELLNAQGTIVAVTFTDANGNYKFDQLTRGTYTVREIQPTGYFDSGDHIGTINGVLTGTRSANDVLGEIALLAGPNGINYNFCENPPAQLSGVVFQDGTTLVVAAGPADFPANIYDGRLTSDDTRLAGVTLRLSRPDGQPIFDVNGNRVQFAVTDSLGRYSFVGLPKGTYIVTEAQPAGYQDWIDTPGTTGGSRVAPDTLAGISLNWGEHSQQNNFSEVLATPPPFIVYNPPDPPPPFNPNPQAPPPAAPPLLNPLIVQPPPAPDYYDNGIVGYTWHLSVVNGGRPRTSRLTQSQLVAREREIAELEMERPDWGAEAVKQGRFILRTGDEDQAVDRELVFGVERGTPVVGDFNGDGNTDVGVYRFGTWYVDLNGNGQWDEQDLWAKLGRRDDLPVTGDWDGDGKHDIAIFGRAWPGDPRHIRTEPGLPSAENAQYGLAKNVPPQAEEATMGIRSMQLTSAGKMRSDLIDHVFLYGWGGDVPISGDWTHEGQEMIGIFRDGNWKLDLTGDGKYTDEDRAFTMGEQGDKPVIGDFNGDTIVDLGVYRDGLWHIDTNNDGVLDARDRAFTFGESGDKPVVGDWDGDGVDDPGLYRDGPKDSRDSQ
jgi:serine-aspartate repeat-containing protein C/D/E